MMSGGMRQASFFFTVRFLLAEHPDLRFTLRDTPYAFFNTYCIVIS